MIFTVYRVLKKIKQLKLTFNNRMKKLYIQNQKIKKQEKNMLIFQQLLTK